jgi:hypothetical protein
LSVRVGGAIAAGAYVVSAAAAVLLEAVPFARPDGAGTGAPPAVVGVPPALVGHGVSGDGTGAGSTEESTTNGPTDGSEDTG